MGYSPYRGPVKTLEQAMFADMPVLVTCQTCGHFRQAHAFRVMQWIAKRVKAKSLPLFAPVADIFYCRRCRKRVTVVITAPLAWTLGA